ncbi:MAG: cytochrome c [Gammaproteobacteria bacterium]|nr:cytochrome c [Gammaproteobacteria bacterium]
MKRIALAVMVLLLNAGAGADEAQIRLVDAPGRDVLMGNCSVCHSVDYVLMSAGIPDRKGWEASIGKMRRIMGATISDADSAIILDYLASNYGADLSAQKTTK